MVTGKSQGVDSLQLPATSPDPIASNSPPSKRDLASWWRQFKRNSRKEELKGTSVWIFFEIWALQSVCDSPVGGSGTRRRSVRDPLKLLSRPAVHLEPHR